MKYYQFSHTATEKAPNNINLDKVKQIFNNGNASIWYSDLMSKGIIKLAGWLFDFKEDLKNYVVKQDGRWFEVYAPNKTLLRKNLPAAHRITKIMEVK